MMNNLVGQKFGRLLVKEYDSITISGHSKWLCQCDCGNKKIVLASDLKSGHTKSCGCLLKEGNSLKHGHDKKGQESRTYMIWRSMKQRCSNPKNASYKNYGDRGITVCERWANKKTGYQNFLKDIGEIPEDKSLDRIDNDTGYHRGNCRLSTWKEQGRNRRNNRKIKINNKERLLIEVAEEHKISPSLLRQRLKMGQSIEEALSRPIELRRKKTLTIYNYELQLRRALTNLKLKNNNKIGFSKYLPYNSKQLHDHLETIKKSQNNCCPMCHKSYDNIKYDIDHIIPVSTAQTKEELLKLFNLENLSSLCYICNRYIKRNKIATVEKK